MIYDKIITLSEPYKTWIISGEKGMTGTVEKPIGYGLLWHITSPVVLDTYYGGPNAIPATYVDSQGRDQMVVIDGDYVHFDENYSGDLGEFWLPISDVIITDMGIGFTKRVEVKEACIPNWQCEIPLNGYEFDGCGNRRENDECIVSDYGYLSLYCNYDYAIILIDGLSVKMSTKITGTVHELPIGLHTLRLELKDMVYNETFEIKTNSTTTIYAELVPDVCIPDWQCEIDLDGKNTGWKTDINNCLENIYDDVMCPVGVEPPEPSDNITTYLIIGTVGLIGLKLISDMKK